MSLVPGLTIDRTGNIWVASELWPARCDKERKADGRIAAHARNARRSGANALRQTVQHADRCGVCLDRRDLRLRRLWQSPGALLLLRWRAGAFLGGNLAWSLVSSLWSTSSRRLPDDRLIRLRSREPPHPDLHDRRRRPGRVDGFRYAERSRVRPRRDLRRRCGPAFPFGQRTGASWCSLAATSRSPARSTLPRHLAGCGREHLPRSIRPRGEQAQPRMITTPSDASHPSCSCRPASEVHSVTGMKHSARN